MAEQTVREWVLLEEVGRGAMGIVRRARNNLWPDRDDLVVKVVHPHWIDDPRSRQAFLREAALLGRLRHSNIIESHPPFEDDGVLYLPMELLRGCSLQTSLERRPGPRTEAEALWITSEAARGLAHAHGLEPPIVHLDVKPSNVFLLENGGVKVLDFGLARSLGASGASSAHGAGTPLYMAPEVLRGQRAGPAADVYALGLVLYQLLTGRLPFIVPDDAPVAAAHFLIHQAQEQGLARVSTHREVSPWLDDAVALLLATDPAERPRDAAALLHVLRAERPAAETRLAFAEPRHDVPDLSALGPSSHTLARAEAEPGERPARKSRRAAYVVSASMAALAGVGGLYAQHPALTVGTTPPGAELRVDGETVAERTPTRRRVSTGRHIVELQRGGYRTQRARVSVGWGAEHTSYFELVPSGRPVPPVQIYLAEGSGSVEIDGTRYGSVHKLSVDLDRTKSHVLKIERGGATVFRDELPAGEVFDVYDLRGEL